MVLVSTGLFLCLLASFFPRSGDDWAWGSSIGIERLHTMFAGYNGRYLGNFSVLFLSHATWLVPLVVAATMCILMWFVADLAGQRDAVGVIAAVGIVIGMPLGVWQQSVVWLSGFSNYALASIVLLAFLRSARRDLEGDALGLPRAGVLFVFVVAGQLFIEHVTMFVVIGSMALLVARLARKWGPSVRSVVWLTGAIVGAAIMFSNSAYWGVSASGVQYQQVGSSGHHSALVSAIIEGTGGVSQYAVAINTVLNAVLAVLIGGLVLVARRRSGAVGTAQLAAVALAGLGLLVGVAVNASVQSNSYFGSLTRWSWVAAVAELGAVLLAAGSLVRDRRRVLAMRILAAAVVTIVVPMAAVRPYGPRNFLPSYLMMAVIALLLLAELRKQAESGAVAGAAIAIGLAISVVVGTGYLVTYDRIHQAEQTRVNTIRSAVQAGRHAARVYTLPDPAYVHVPDPVGNFATYFKLYYQIPEHFRIRLVDRYARTDLGVQVK